MHVRGLRLLLLRVLPVHRIILIHVCARIATNQGFQGAEPPLFWFMHARRLQRYWVVLWWQGQILIHACAKIATRPLWSMTATPVFWFMHARRLQQFFLCLFFALHFFFDSCMREDCNVIDQDEASMVRISIHACARIATLSFRFFLCLHLISIHACARIAIGYWTHLGLGVAYFNSCMREDCNLQIPKRADRIWYFDSCMREDCNGFRLLPKGNFCDFDSCMREDCNPRIIRTRTSRRFWFMHVRGLQFILHDKDTNILIHACARIAISAPMWPRPVRQSFWFMHVRGLQRDAVSRYNGTVFWFMHARRLQQANPSSEAHVLWFWFMHARRLQQ